MIRRPLNVELPPGWSSASHPPNSIFLGVGIWDSCLPIKRANGVILEESKISLAKLRLGGGWGCPAAEEVGKGGARDAPAPGIILEDDLKMADLCVCAAPG